MGVMDLKREAIDAHSTSRMALARGELSAASSWAAHGDQLDRRFVAQLTALLEDSTRVFSDWKKDPERRIQVGG
jgi:hypothetical protein